MPQQVTIRSARQRPPPRTVGFVAEVAQEMTEARRLVKERLAEESVVVGRDGKMVLNTARKGISKNKANKDREVDGAVPLGKMLRCRIRYFTAGAVIGSRIFVDEAFEKSRDRFGMKRKSGARKLKGEAAPASGYLWSLRDLRKGIT